MGVSFPIPKTTAPNQNPMLTPNPDAGPENDKTGEDAHELPSLGELCGKQPISQHFLRRDSADTRDPRAEIWAQKPDPAGRAPNPDAPTARPLDPGLA